MTIQPVPRSLENSPFRILKDDTLRHTFEYLTIQELAKAAPTCRLFNERMTWVMSLKACNEVISFCKIVFAGSGLQKLNEIFSQICSAGSLCSSHLESLQDESFALEMSFFRSMRGISLQTLEAFSRIQAAPVCWPSCFTVSMAFERMTEQTENNPEKAVLYRQTYQEVELSSFARGEGVAFFRAWKKGERNLLLGNASDRLIEKVAKKAISDGYYGAAKNLAKITKSYVSKLFILQIADKYKKNPKVAKAPKKPFILPKFYDQGSPLPDYKSKRVVISKEAESRAKTLNVLEKRLIHKEKREAETKYLRSQISRAAADAPQKNKDIKKPLQKLRMGRR